MLTMLGMLARMPDAGCQASLRESQRESLSKAHCNPFQISKLYADQILIL